jgi:hypothetical protein
MRWTSDELLASLQRRPSPNAYRKLMDDLRNPKYKRAAMLPMAVNTETGKREMALPSIFVDMLEAAMLPGDVYQGNTSMYGEDGRTNPQVINRSADLAGLLTLGSGAIPAEANSLRMGIKAYHGSPHDFDRFDMSKIGTGEGAQAYGHGLYFAENEGVAQGYKARTTAQHGTYSLDGKPLQSMHDFAKMHDELNAAGDWRASKAFNRIYSDVRQGYPIEDAMRIARDWYRGEPEMLDAVEKIGARISHSRPQGSMYEVNIDANPDDFLDWDKPLNEQPAYQKIKSGIPEELRPHGSKIGRVAVQDITYNVGDPTKVSEKLKAAGIPGIKYLDAGSRGAGDGSRNYVVFDDKLISIVKKYGVAALVSAGVLSQAQGEEMKAQGYY